MLVPVIDGELDAYRPDRIQCVAELVEYLNAKPTATTTAAASTTSELNSNETQQILSQCNKYVQEGEQLYLMGDHKQARSILLKALADACQTLTFLNQQQYKTNTTTINNNNIDDTSTIQHSTQSFNRLECDLDRKQAVDSMAVDIDDDDNQQHCNTIDQLSNLSIEAYQHQDNNDNNDSNKQAIGQAQELCIQPMGRALLLLGLIWKDGVMSNERNWSQAFDYFVRASMCGYALAIQYVGLCQNSGRGVAENKQLANDNFVLSSNVVCQGADNGDWLAQFLLASRLDFEYACAQDMQLAAMWYRRSAEQGYALAANNLYVTPCHRECNRTKHTHTHIHTRRDSRILVMVSVVDWIQ
jgi:TPR repeat protein